AVAALGLGLLLGGCRQPRERAGFVYPFDYYYAEPFESRFVPRDDAVRGKVFAERHPVGRAQAFPREKAPGAFRAFVVGGSVAQAYDEQRGVRPALSDALAGLFVGRKVEVVNLGRAGYDSERDVLAVEEVLSYSPDLVVVMDGVNEAYPSLPARWRVRVARWLRGWPLLGGAWQDRVVADSLERTPKDAEAQGLRFESNVRRMARLARERGVPIALCALPINIRDMPPRGELPLRHPAFLRAWVAWEQGDGRRAEGLFEEAVRERPEDLMGHYFLGRCLDRRGGFDAARDRYRRVDAQTKRVRYFNAISRRVAREEGALLADLEEAFAAVSPQGLPGRNLFEDDLHWHRFVDPLVTLTIARSLVAPGVPGADPGWVRAQAPAIERSVRRTRVTRDQAWFVFRHRMWSPIYWRETQGFSERVIALLETIREADPGLLGRLDGFKGWLRGQLRDNVWDRDAAKTFESWWPLLLGHAGELFRRAGEHDLAQRYFSAALEGAVEAGEAGAATLRRVRLGLALSLLQSGREDEGRRELSRLGDDGRAREVWSAYAQAWAGRPAPRHGRGRPLPAPDVERLTREADRVLTGGRPGAAAADETGGSSSPKRDDRVRRLVDKALAAFGRGDVEGASRDLDAALRIAPSDADALMSRGALRSMKKDWPSAIGDYDALLRALRDGGPEGMDEESKGVLWADAMSARGAALEGLGRADEARRAYAEALQKAPRAWPRRAEVRAALERGPGGGEAP
ncbi:MAG: tetratricopeptide repeat protein, partial [Elusimicrobia bacterium]|nr:tetratricopeptide repeat protein [Elusimicrobiota bacterium]